MKIKGPGGYSGPPVPPEPDSVGSKPTSKFEPQETQSAEVAQKKGATAAEPSSFEKGLQEIARSRAGGGEIPVGKIVDSVLEEVLGKDFASKPGGAAVKEAIVPLISQDEHLMGKLNSILSRLDKS
ncbi:MAG TPA: hypothetical protein VH815_07115 [Acidobacteriota bacterium]|jgi:hypothetical protein